MPRIRRSLLVALAYILPAVAAAGDRAHPLTFEADVRPILKARCFHCHGEEDAPKGHLDLRLVRSMTRGGDSGGAIAPGHHEESLLWERVEAGEMPPGEKKLDAREKATLAAWIDQGAPTARPEPERVGPRIGPTPEERAFWSFQPVRRPPTPRVRAAETVQTPVDAFLLEALEARGGGFAPEAGRRTLIRRVTFDLIGLPPTPEDVDAFLEDDAPGAYERLVDRLLASPRYGERWSRHWLDVAGYADSDGYSPSDTERRYAYKYRDYLIRSLNADRRWDEMVREQLAGDEMVPAPHVDLKPGDVDRLAATGFLRMAPDGTSDPETNQVAARNDVIAETIKIVSTSMLGLTVGCAQCHSHRYDPISHEDYYRFRALFEPAYDPARWRVPAARLISLWGPAERERAAAADAEVNRINTERAEALDALVETVLGRELAAAPEALRKPLREARATPVDKRTPEQAQLLKAYPRVNVTVGSVYLYDHKAHADLLARFAGPLKAAAAKRPAEDYVAALTEAPGKAPVTRLLYRGDAQQPRQPVAPGELSVLEREGGLPAIPDDDPGLPGTGRRLAYARHLTDGRHPLVPRVLANRIWLHHFGRGIVNTPGDFGSLGDRPTHPALLDWLADELVHGGWTLKRIHRLIVTSTAYRQSSRRGEGPRSAAADDRLLGRMPVRRLEAEAVRDAMLAASGRLDSRMFGPPVPVTLDDVGQVVVGMDNRDTAGRPSGPLAGLGGAEFRRSLYIQARRSLPLGLLETFDAPAMAPNCDRRASSTVAPQSLLMMNNAFVVAESAAFAARVAAAAGDDPAARVRLAWRCALGREPGPEEVALAGAFLRRQADDLATIPPVAKGKAAAPDLRALATFCQALFSANAFLYID